MSKMRVLVIGENALDAIELSKELRAESNENSVLVKPPHLGVRSLAGGALDQDRFFDFSKLFTGVFVFWVTVTAQVCQYPHAILILILCVVNKDRVSSHAAAKL